MSKPHLLLEFHLTGSSASSPQTLWAEDLCARVNCYISELLLYFNTAAVCLQRTRSSTAEWPKLTRQCVHMRMTEWVKSACMYAWWREKEKEKARRSCWIFVQCVLANVGMCAYLSVLNGCFLSSKPQPNSSTFSFSSPFFFALGGKKEESNLTVPVLYKGLYNISCREPQRLLRPPKNTEGADEWDGSKDRFPSVSLASFDGIRPWYTHFDYTLPKHLVWWSFKHPTLMTRQVFHTFSTH